MNQPQRAELIEEVLQTQHQFLRYVVQDGTVPGLAELDLTMLQLRALCVVASLGPLPVGALGAALGLGKSAASLQVNSLARRGMVERREDPSDRRRTLVQLSPYGDELIEELLRGRQELSARWMQQMSIENLAALAQGLHALLEVVARSDQEQSA